LTHHDDVVEILVRETGLSASDLAGDRSLIDLGVTSFAIVRVLLAVEEHLARELSADPMEEVASTSVSLLPDIIRGDFNGHPRSRRDAR